MMVIVDTSGSMDASTGSGKNSCGRTKSRLSDAKCVLTDIVNSYGNVVFGLERFKENTSGTPSFGPTGCGTRDCQTTCPESCNACTVNTLICNTCDPTAATPAAGNCPPIGGDASQGEILAPIVDHQQDQLLKWIDYSVNGCGSTATDPELSADTWTPIGGSLRGARRYFEGGDPVFNASPIDPTNACRPYYVILLTDGDESCTTFNETLAATDELRKTSAGGSTYDIKTYTIGIGITPNSPSGTRLQTIASHGGSTAYYASDEQTLALAFAQIIKASLLVEVCNGKDDNCNGLIDEGFTLYCDKKGGHSAADLCVNPGDQCDGVDDNCYGGTSDEVHNACGTCGAAPTEVCNSVDDNCNGIVDEGLNCTCIVQPEICDNIDNDCDGATDETLTRACGSNVGSCTLGVETCSQGIWQGCTAKNGMPELCNGIDDDCDGVTDGIARACGHPAVGNCQPGTQICKGGDWASCVGNVEPGAELCDRVDNNCDGQTDEGNPGGGAACSSACGQGAVTCVAGKLSCVGAAGTGKPEVCNGIDDNCDGVVDEGLDRLGACNNNGLLCVAGESKCISGKVQCVGGAPPETEVCDCKDNNCDGQVDNGTLCGAGATCLGAGRCQCAFPCASSEFPCPSGFRCIDSSATSSGFCVVDPCAGIRCPALPNGSTQTCVDGACVSLCSTITCGAPLVCRPTDGQCVKNDCSGLAGLCSPSQLCISGQCVEDLCLNVTCAAGQFCRKGACVASCGGVSCTGSTSCRDGTCQGDPCIGVNCPANEECDPGTGQCAPNQCLIVLCGNASVCNPFTGSCEVDPCLGVRCPAGQFCSKGNCFSPPNPNGDVPRTYVGVTGTGLTSCSFGRTHHDGSIPGLPLLIVSGMFALFATRLRRKP